MILKVLGTSKTGPCECISIGCSDLDAGRGAILPALCSCRVLLLRKEERQVVAGDCADEIEVKDKKTLLATVEFDYAVC